MHSEEGVALAARSPATGDVRGAWRVWAVRLLALAVALYLVQTVSLAATAVPVRLVLASGRLGVQADGQQVSVPLPGDPTAVRLLAPNPLVHEFQLDGTDSINNFSTDVAYLGHISASPYFRLYEWMRDTASYSAWRDVQASVPGGALHPAAPDTLGMVQLPAASLRLLEVRLLRPEVPARLQVLCGAALCAEVEINRNERFLSAVALQPTGERGPEARVFFPQRPLPFLAEVLYQLARIGLWALAMVVAAGALALALAPPLARLPRWGAVARAEWWPRLHAAAPMRALPARLRAGASTAATWAGEHRADVVALGITGAALLATVWIALAQYAGKPHLLDASAYYFQAKIFASGQLSVPVPANPTAFAGPFMVTYQGRWFAQYAPATSAVLALGMLARVPWLVEPLLGALSLWGIYRIGRRLFDVPTALLALGLAALSPFYLYLAAAYLSHTVALFFAVYAVLFLLRFAETLRTREAVLAAACASGLLLTRELSAVVLCGSAAGYVLALEWRRLWAAGAQAARGLLAGMGVLLLGAATYLAYNAAQTGNPLQLPRLLFFAGDRYGFGMGVGFYGQHTLAAGLVILDQLLTLLQIDLFGWPFAATLLFVPLAFLHRERRRWDVFCLLVGGLLVLAQVGYFYHGIFLGPRYLFESLPFLVLLTARGLTGLAARAGAVAAWFSGARGARLAGVVSVSALLGVLVLCNLLFYLPRQAALHTGFTGMPASMLVDVAALYGPMPHNALVLTSDWYIYSYVLFPLNDPRLAGDTIYALATAPATITALREEFPRRTLYMLKVDARGGVHLVRLP